MCDPSCAPAWPDNLSELDEKLKMLEAWRPLGVSEYEELTKHEQRVYGHAGNFP